MDAASRAARERRRSAHAMLDNATELFRAVLDDASDAIIAADVHQRIRLFNGAAEQMFGYPADEVVGRALTILLPEDVRRAHPSHVRDFAAEPVLRRTMSDRPELRGQRRDGTQFPVEVTISKLTVDGQLLFTAIVRDITQRREAEQARDRADARLRALIQHSSDAIIVVGSDYDASYVSPSYVHLLGYTAQQRRERSGLQLIHPHDRTRYAKTFADVAARPGSTCTVETRAQHADGSWRWVQVTMTNLVNDPAVAGIVLNARDFTARKRAEEALAHQALHDELTGLPNRTLLLDRIDRALRRRSRTGREVGVVFLDLDDFKLINDSSGHGTGDRLLQAVAARLQGVTRSEDTVSRIGGDEFVVLVEEVSGIDDLISAALRITDALRRPFMIDNREIFTTASLGLCHTDGTANSAQLLLANADAAMYQAKARGGARFEAYGELLRSEAVARMTLESELHYALPRGELRVHYQPVISLATGRTVGVEALARWQHPTRDLVGPALFIPAAERTGLIVPMGWFVLTEACSQLIAWNDEAPELGAMVNLSARQLEDRQLPSWVAGLLDQCGLDPARLTLEITESVIVDDSPETQAVLHDLKDLGIHLAIDDFGTGYSSLAHLKRLPADVLKIERSFVQAIDADPRDAAVVAAVIEVAHARDLIVVAEGVETPGELAALTAMGCDRAQGFYLATPQPADRLDIAATLADPGPDGRVNSRRTAANRPVGAAAGPYG